MAFFPLHRGHLAETKLAIRVAAAGGVAFAIAEWLQLPQGFWAVITAVIVMQASLGASLKAAFDRLLGTLAGAAWGAAVALLFSGWGVPYFLAAVILALLPLAFLAAVNPAFKVAPVTALIVMLPNPLVQVPPLEAALDRVLEIALGNAVGIFVALTVFPARARSDLTAAAARICDLNAELMKAHFGNEAAERIAAIHARIRASLKQCEAAADEARRERAAHLSSEPDAEPLIRTLYRVRHDLVMIGRAAANAPASARPAALAAAADLKSIAGALRDCRAPQRSDGLEPALKLLGRPGRGEADSARAHALRFAFEQLSQNLGDLAARAGERV